MNSNVDIDELRTILCDISQYLRKQLQSLQYQNTALAQNEEQCKELLTRCDTMLVKFSESSNCELKFTDCRTQVTDSTECSYLDMSSKTTPNEYVDFNGLPESEDESCTQKLNVEDYKETYDICNVSSQVVKTVEDPSDLMNCPYVGLPATHLQIQKSPKFGQLLRIEKRLFFDQTKKYYCGLLHDWLLCYSDGIASLKPSLCFHLIGVEVEHYGEGKRRDVCFQISDYETTKKIIFQAMNEVDTKEWIHAIEGAIRGDFNTSSTDSSGKGSKLPITISNNSINNNNNNNTRKLPTPPVQKKQYNNIDSVADGIYEEPCPLYTGNYEASSTIHVVDSSTLKPPDIPVKTGIKFGTAEGTKHEYDVPRVSALHADVQNCIFEPSIAETPSPCSKEEFQTKVKDVHSKLNNHLSSGPNFERIKSMKKSPTQSPQNDAKKHAKKGTQLCKDKEKQSNTTPVKSWFLNRLSKTSPQNLPKAKPGDKEKENLLGSGISSQSTTKPLKGGKVNMIINQLEANGHLPIFSRHVERFSHAYIDSVEDCSYEPIMTSGSTKG